MDLGLNLVDWIILAALLFFVLESFGRPFLAEVVDFLSFLLAFFLSFRYYNFAAKFFENQFNIPHGLSLVLGFMAVWFLSETVFYILARTILVKIPKPKIYADRILAFIPALLRGLIFISLTLVLFATFPIQPQVKKSILNSKIGSFLLKKAYALEQPVKNVFGGVTNDTLTFLTIKPRTDERVNLGFQTYEFSIDSQTEEEMIKKVNKERVGRGLKVLEFDAKLREVARGHSADMFERGYFSHYSPEGKNVADRVTSEGVDFLVIGENLAFAPNLELAHRGLMNSLGHKANILSEDYGRIGVGVIDGGIYGEMFTQVFSD